MDQERSVVASLALHAVLEPVFSEVCLELPSTLRGTSPCFVCS
jgi:hypothetical protein